jgi:Fe2+ transport system protein FeoA
MFMSDVVHELIPLNLAPAGASVRVAQLLGAPEETRRLEELGLRQGTVLEVIQSGSPCIVRLSEHKLCFRQGETFHVLVTVGEAR